MKESRFELVQVDLWPVVRIAAAVFTVIGIVVGIFAFLVFPHPSSAGLSFSTRLLSALLFAVLYTLIVTLGIALVIWLYNVMSSSFGWTIRVKLQDPAKTE